MILSQAVHELLQIRQLAAKSGGPTKGEGRPDAENNIPEKENESDLKEPNK